MTGNLHDKRACFLNEIGDRCNKVEQTPDPTLLEKA
jgi:hypothetical protein